MNHRPTSGETVLHQALLDLMQAKGLRLVEMDQFIYPEEHESVRLRAGPPTQSRLYLQLVDGQGRTVASDSYVQGLSPARSPFIGVRAEPGSERQRVLDKLAKALSNS